GALEHNPDLLADPQTPQVAVDEIGQDRRTFFQRDIADRIRAACRFAHQTETIDLALARTFLPHRLVGETERTDAARKIMRLTACRATLDQKLAFGGLLPEFCRLGIALRSRVFRGVSHYARSRMQVEAA